MGTPIWKVVLDAAHELDAEGRLSFPLKDLIERVQNANPTIGRSSIQPVVQGMTSNAGTGPPSPCGKVFVRVSHGWYQLRASSILMTTSPLPSVPDTPRSPRAGRRRRPRSQPTPSALKTVVPGPDRFEGFTLAGPVTADSTNVPSPPIGAGRTRHPWGAGPFAVLEMPPLPSSPGLYIWAIDGAVVYVGQTERSLVERLGPAGYSRITPANVQAAEPGRTNGGQQTNCRINALVNAALVEGRTGEIWVRELPAQDAKRCEADWFRSHGRPLWNRA